MRKASQYTAVIASLVAASALTAQAEDGLKVSGFVDPQYNYSLESDVITSGGRSSLGDGALYLNKTFGNGMAVIDLSFADLEILRVSEGYSQAYIGYKYDNGLSWTFGAQDGIFGLERNDHVDNFFGNQGIVYALQPKFHTALIVKYAISPEMNVSVYTGGSDRTGTASRPTPQFGGKFEYTGAFRLGVGGFMESAVTDDELSAFRSAVAEAAAEAAGVDASLLPASVITAAANGALTKQFINATVGYDVGSLALDAQLSMKTLATDGAEATMGYGVQAIYGMNDTTKIGLRYEMVEDAMNITAGPAFAMSKDLTVKVNVNYADSGVEGADAVTTLGLAGTYRF